MAKGKMPAFLAKAAPAKKSAVPAKTKVFTSKKAMPFKKGGGRRGK